MPQGKEVIEFYINELLSEGVSPLLGPTPEGSPSPETTPRSLSPICGGLTSLVGEGAQAAPIIIESPPTPCTQRKGSDAIHRLGILQLGASASNMAPGPDTEGKNMCVVLTFLSISFTVMCWPVAYLFHLHHEMFLFVVPHILRAV
jgi:hypothetical protein